MAVATLGAGFAYSLGSADGSQGGLLPTANAAEAALGSSATTAGAAQNPAQPRPAPPAEQPPTAEPGWFARLTGYGAGSSPAAGQEPATAAKHQSGTADDSGGGSGGPRAALATVAAAGSGGSGGAAEEPDGWWTWVKSSVARAPAPAPPVHVPLPTDKLCCKLPADRWAGMQLLPCSQPFRESRASASSVHAAQTCCLLNRNVPSLIGVKIQLNHNLIQRKCVLTHGTATHDKEERQGT